MTLLPCRRSGGVVAILEQDVAPSAGRRGGHEYPGVPYEAGFQPSAPARYCCGVASAACSSVSWGRLAFTVAPAPVLPYSKNRPSVHRFGDMSAHGWVVVRMAAGRLVLRMVT